MMRSIADGEQFQIPSTIDDEAIIDEIRDVLAHAKIGCFK
jgi:propionyl-CoA synthetase